MNAQPKSFLKRLFVRKPKYVAERKRLRDAIASGVLDPAGPLRDSGDRIEKFLVWNSLIDGGDWVELEMEAKERSLSLVTIRDLVQLLESIDAEHH